MQVALYMVSADRRDDVADGRLLGREHYCRDAAEQGASFALALARLVDRQVVRVGDVALAIEEEVADWPTTPAGWVLEPDGWRELTAAELAGFRCHNGCACLVHDNTGPLLLCEHCADALCEHAHDNGSAV